MNNYGRGVRGSCFNFMLLEGKITVFFLTVFIENENINFLPRFANFCDNGAKFLFSACAGGLFYLPHKHPCALWASFGGDITTDIKISFIFSEQ